MITPFKKKRFLLGACSWNNPKLLKLFVDHNLPLIDIEKDTLAIVVNQADTESVSYLVEKKVPFVSLPENNGVLAFDYLLAFITQHEYCANINDDMFFEAGFCDALEKELVSDKYCSISPCLIEGGPTMNPFIIDGSLYSPYDCLPVFNQKISEGVYEEYRKLPNIVGYSHPIFLKTSLFLSVGGYSNNWDNEFLNGFGMDDYFAIKLMSKTGKPTAMTYRVLCYHGVSMSTSRYSGAVRNSNESVFKARTGLSFSEFRAKAGVTSQIE